VKARQGSESTPDAIASSLRIRSLSAAAPRNRPVLVIGERGTGKELIAERLNRLSTRLGGPLVAMNCAALPDTLIEVELFGHRGGAFTGATKARVGRFEDRWRYAVVNRRGKLTPDRLPRLTPFGWGVRVVPVVHRRDPRTTPRAVRSAGGGVRGRCLWAHRVNPRGWGAGGRG